MIQIHWSMIFILLSTGAMIGIALFGLLVSRKYEEGLISWRDRAMLYKDRADKYEKALTAERSIPKVLDFIAEEIGREAALRDDASVQDAQLQNYCYHDGIRHGLTRCLLYIRGML